MYGAKLQLVSQCICSTTELIKNNSGFLELQANFNANSYGNFIARQSNSLCCFLVVPLQGIQLATYVHNYNYIAIVFMYSAWMFVCMCMCKICLHMHVAMCMCMFVCISYVVCTICVISMCMCTH